MSSQVDYNYRLNKFPQTPHENRFAAGSRTPAADNLRSKSYHGKCVCDICTCGQHRCPPSVSPNRYPSNMRSTSQNAFRPFKRDEIQKVNKVDALKTTRAAGTSLVMPSNPTKDNYKTSNSSDYPDHWKNRSVDMKQLRNSPTVQAHRKTFDIFLSTDEKGHFDPLSTKPQNQKPQSLKEQVDKPRSPAGTPLRGRAGTQYTPRRANDTSPDFPLNQSRMMYGSDDAVRTSTGRQKPGRGQDRSVGADRQGKPTYVSPQEEFYPTEESTKKKDPATPTRTPTWQERPTTPNNRTKEVATPPASRGSRGPFSRDLHSNYPSNSTNPQPIDNNNFESINTINTDDRDSVVMQPKRDRYGPARGLPRPSTNQPTLTPQRQIAQSPPKNYAGKPTKRPNELNLFSNEPAQHSRRSTPREDEYVYEEQEDVKSRQATPKQVRTPTQARTPTSEKGFAQPARGLKTPKETTHFNPFERPSHQDQPPKTPVRPKDHGDADSRSSSMTGESANKSPMHSSAMRPMKREDNLRVDRSLPFGSGPGSGSVYKEDFPVKARADTGQIAGKSPQTSGVRDSSETRVFGTIKNLKYNDIKTVYQNDFKEVVMPNFMKKDCPILSLPKPPKVITAGKMHVYYDEDENDWH